MHDFDQNTYLDNLVFSFFHLVRAILEQKIIPPLDRKKMKKISVDRLPSTRIFTMGWNQFCWSDLILLGLDRTRKKSRSGFSLVRQDTSGNFGCPVLSERENSRTIGTEHDVWLSPIFYALINFGTVVIKYERHKMGIWTSFVNLNSDFNANSLIFWGFLGGFVFLKTICELVLKNIIWWLIYLSKRENR